MRIRGWPLVAGLTLLLNIAASPERKTVGARGDPVAAEAAQLDSLLAHHQYDSVQVIAAELIPRALAAGDSSSLRKLLIARGAAEMFTGNLRASLKTFELATEWALAGRDTVCWMDALRGRAYTSAGLGLRTESMALWGRLRDLARQRGDQRREGHALTGLAYGAMLDGDLTRARADYVLAIRLYRSDNDRVGELTPLVGLGRIYSAEGQIDSARACFQRVWVAATEVNQPVDAAHALNNLGAIEHQFGDITLAMSYYQRAFDLHRTSGESTGAITAGSNLALARQDCGQYDAAARILEELLVICNASGLRPDAGMIVKNLGYSRLRAGRLHAARAHCRSALAMGDTIGSHTRLDAAVGLATALPTDSVELAIIVLQREIVRAQGADMTVVSVARITLARLLADRGDFAAARLEARRAIRATEAQPAGWRQAAALLVASRCYREAGDPDSAMTLFEQGMAAADSSRDTNADPGVLPMGDLLRGAEILLVHPPDRPLRERHATFFDTMEGFRSTMRRNAISDPRAKNKEVARAVTLQELQKDILMPGDLLLDYFVTERTAYLFAASRDTTALVMLPAGRGSAIARQVEDYCRVAAERPGAGALSGADMMDLQLALGRSLMGPVSAMVDRADRIMIVPDGYLHAVPFGSLALAGTDGRAGMLLDHAAVFLLPSASALAVVRGQERVETGSFLVVAGGDAGGRSLPGALHEVRTLEKRYAGIVEYSGQIAGEELCDRMESSGIIHLAAHIEVNDQYPWYSGIQVGSVPVAGSPAPVRAAGIRGFEILSAEDSLRVARTFAPDAYLRASEIAGLPLTARLAVLSGCESALGRLTVGGGVVGLSAAFMQAGVPTVVGSIWPIDDKTTVNLMQAFYDRLAEGMQIADALRGAQLELHSHAATAHPSYWAGFVVVGDGRATVPLTRKSSSGLIPLVAGLLLLTLAGWAITRKVRESRHAV